MTPKQQKAFEARQAKAWKATERKTRAARIAHLRAEIRELRQIRKARVAELIANSREKRLDAREKAAEALAKARDTSAIDRKRDELAGLVADRQEDSKRNTRRGRGARRRDLSVYRRETNEEVESNIDPHLVPYFRSIKSTIKGSEHRSRTEELLERAAEDESGVIEASQHQADRWLHKALKTREAEAMKHGDAGASDERGDAYEPPADHGDDEADWWGQFGKVANPKGRPMKKRAKNPTQNRRIGYLTKPRIKSRTKRALISEMRQATESGDHARADEISRQIFERDKARTNKNLATWKIVNTAIPVMSAAHELGDYSARDAGEALQIFARECGAKNIHELEKSDGLPGTIKAIRQNPRAKKPANRNPTIHLSAVESRAWDDDSEQGDRKRKQIRVAAQATANRTGNTVEIESDDGITLDVMHAEKQNPRKRAAKKPANRNPTRAAKNPRTRIGPGQKYGAFDADGLAWGVGNTSVAARKDAARWLKEANASSTSLEVYPVTEHEAVQIMMGDTSVRPRKTLRQNPAPGYAAMHWGQKGTTPEKTMRAADPKAEPLVELGTLISVVYRTKKGSDRELTDYEHEFEGTRPTLAFHTGGLVIAGGGYKVNTRGIVG